MAGRQRHCRRRHHRSRPRGEPTQYPHGRLRLLVSPLGGGSGRCPRGWPTAPPPASMTCGGQLRRGSLEAGPPGPRHGGRRKGRRQPTPPAVTSSTTVPPPGKGRQPPPRRGRPRSQGTPWPTTSTDRNAPQNSSRNARGVVQTPPPLWGMTRCSRAGETDEAQAGSGGKTCWWWMQTERAGALHAREIPDRARC